MSITSTEILNISNLLTNLPKLKSINDFSSLIDISTQNMDQNRLTLFEFLTLNMSLSNAPLSEKIKELKCFIQIRKAKPGITQSFDSELCIKVILNYFNAFTKAINQKQFYNKKENVLLIADLLHLIPLLNSSKGLGLDGPITSFLLSLNDNSKKYEKHQLKAYDYHINQLAIDYLSQPQDVPLNPNEMITRNYQSANINNAPLQKPPATSSKDEQYLPKPSIQSSINSNSNANTNKHRSSAIVSLPILRDICNKQYNLHLKQAKFYSCYFFKDEQYIIRKIGSYTLGLNTPESSLDYLIERKQNKKEPLSFSEVANWLNKQIIYGQLFTYDSEGFNCFSKKILLFTITELNTFEKKPAKVFLYNERFILINQSFKSFFYKMNVFSKLYVFFNSLLCLENGLHLGLLIHGFFICHYKLYEREKKYYSYKCLVQKVLGQYSLKSKAYFILEVTSQDFANATNDDVDTLIPAFLSFFIQITGKVTPNSQRDLIKRKNYLFSLDKVIKYLLKNKSKDYWEKIINFYGMIVEKSKQALNSK